MSEINIYLHTGFHPHRNTYFHTLLYINFIYIINRPSIVVDDDQGHHIGEDVTRCIWLWSIRVMFKQGALLQFGHWRSVFTKGMCLCEDLLSSCFLSLQFYSDCIGWHLLWRCFPSQDSVVLAIPRCRGGSQIYSMRIWVCTLSTFSMNLRWACPAHSKTVSWGVLCQALQRGNLLTWLVLP